MRLVVVLLCVSMLGGCFGTSKGYVKASNVKPSIDAMVERDNKYIAGDEDLSDVQKSQLTTENNVLKAVFDEAVKED